MGGGIGGVSGAVVAVVDDVAAAGSACHHDRSELFDGHTDGQPGRQDEHSRHHQSRLHPFVGEARHSPNVLGHQHPAFGGGPLEDGQIRGRPQPDVLHPAPEVDEAFLERRYEALLAASRCLVENGYPQEEAPSQQTWVASRGAAWDPYAIIFTQSGIAAGEAAGEACPAS